MAPGEGGQTSPTGDQAAALQGAGTEQQRSKDPLGKPPVIIEFCCDPDSEVGKVKGQCKVFRITKHGCDVSTAAGVDDALATARANPGALLFTSIPCTTGCPYWHANKARPGAKQRHRKQKRELEAILRNWLPVARQVTADGGCVAWEWPRNSPLWQHDKVKAFIKEFNLETVLFDGCAFGVCSQCGANRGMPIKKPWRIDTNCPELYRAFQGKMCPGVHKHPQHAPCQGGDTVKTGHYTPSMARNIHREIGRASCRERV